MKIYTIKAQDFKIDTLVAGTIISSVEVSEETLRNLIKENPELIDFWGDEIRNNFLKQPTHKRKYFVPELKQKYFFLGTSGDMLDAVNYNDNIDIGNIKLGNCFATEQDAWDELNRRQALVRIWNNYDDKYSWDIDWKDRDIIKYPLSYDWSSKKFNLYNSGYALLQNSTELPYFKSAEDRNQFVSENEIDLLTIFNIKK